MSHPLLPYLVEYLSMVMGDSGSNGKTVFVAVNCYLTLIHVRKLPGACKELITICLINQKRDMTTWQTVNTDKLGILLVC